MAIVEQKDANADQLNIKEVNTGVMVSDGAGFKKWLARVGNNNAQGEYYLTDLIALANQDNCQVIAVQATDVMEVEGANNRLQLAALERYFQNKTSLQIIT
ncbi:bifunctional N-acetylglucosamine-1-phosphate uridyltransferase/glucosamine-1-phosphate acetyltransferase [Haemophilus influenzae 22.4-21]|uniref:Bifunctional N-acetylglucosamine-1-phosphate uridyltransferase/glucosamine-1-phosphate acetyltransferase n=1 Tax=Haemophilus influenzae 22.4-21 TaxID=375063 RepID=A4P0U9_HAEIF|nr:bifunctional N-acetylglucosamine-1-phosphate uridyltransferase/glucosamine-1-phosphate acetyltransferase [Haemophilus influenzae 22.4-21]